MSIGGALSSAKSGLHAAARAAEVISNNVANARTEAYGRRELSLSSRSIGAQGQGVRVNGVVRQGDPALLADRRSAGGDALGAGLREAFLRRIETAVGRPGDPAALGGRLDTLDAALVAAAGRPESDVLLDDVLGAAGAVARHVNAAGRAIQDDRAAADRAIAATVSDLNRILREVETLNERIARHTIGGRDVSALHDQRQLLVDRISEQVPLREVARPNGVVALYTPRGAALVDGRAAQFGFSAAGVVTAEMTLASGALSGLTLDGRPMIAAGAPNGIAGGALAARFEVRDVLAPRAQGRLDAVARELVTRFADPASDPTLAAGAPGFFTDDGAAFDPVAATGLAGRLAINAAVDPAQGGALWRLRAGIGAVAAGPVGASAGLLALAGAVQTPRVPGAGDFWAGARSMPQLGGDLAARSAADRLDAEDEAAFAGARAAAFRDAELNGGIDTDLELQELLQVETAYAANARVIQIATQMMQAILEI
jgi:flagellar hook-associated protein 1 FlgK